MDESGNIVYILYLDKSMSIFIKNIKISIDFID